MSKPTTKQFNSALFCAFVLSLFYSGFVNAQVPLKVVAGTLFVDGGISRTFDQQKYKATSDSLRLAIKKNPRDTTSLFYSAVIILFSNDMFAKPYQRTEGALENLLYAKLLADSAVNLNMKDFRLRVLRAQIHSELTFRYSGDESWMFNAKQIAKRRKDFLTYKTLANKYYDALAIEDQNNAWDYQKLKINYEYRL